MGLSHEQLVIRIGLEPESASTRLNRCELGKRSQILESVGESTDEASLESRARAFF